MLRKRELSTATPNTLLLGVASKGKAAATAAIRLANGEIESECGEYIASNAFEAAVAALDDLRVARLPHLVILTTDAAFLQFLKHPFVKPTAKQMVTVGRETFTVGVGGDPYQWQLLRLLFPYVWIAKSVEKLPKAEGLL